MSSQPPAPTPPGGQGPPGPPGGSGLPARRLSSAELEAVIQRAVELQTTREEMADGITEGEVVRIGQELGLEPHVVRRAIAEVRSRAPAEQGMMAGMMGGPGTVRAGRTIRRPATEVGMFLEQYLLQAEYMVVERRFPDRTRYLRAGGIGAAMGRAFSQVSARQARLDLERVDVSVALADSDTSYVELSVDLRGVRTGMAAGGWATGLGTGGAAAVIAAATTAPVLALVGIPLLAGSVLGSRWIYRHMLDKLQDKLEGLLDRLEHNELKLPQQRPKPDWRKQLGI